MSRVGVVTVGESQRRVTLYGRPVGPILYEPNAKRTAAWLDNALEDLAIFVCSPASMAHGGPFQKDGSVRITVGDDGVRISYEPRRAESESPECR